MLFEFFLCLQHFPVFSLSTVYVRGKSFDSSYLFCTSSTAGPSGVVEKKTRDVSMSEEEPTRKCFSSYLY